VVVLKALEKDRTKRYQSAAELAVDIRRHLRGEPIEARPTTAWMKAARWVGRHPALMTTVVVCIVLIVASIGLSLASIWYLNARPHRLVVLVLQRRISSSNRASMADEILQVPTDGGHTAWRPMRSPGWARS